MATEDTERRAASRAASWIGFTVIRLGIFAVVFLVLDALGAGPIFGAVLAAVIALCISIIFLGRQRRTLADDLQAARHRPAAAPAPGADELLEDAAIDGEVDESDQNANAAPRPTP